MRTATNVEAINSTRSICLFPISCSSTHRKFQHYSPKKTPSKKQQTKIYEMADLPLLGVLRGHAAGVTALSHHPTLDMFASGDENGCVLIGRNALATRRSQHQFHLPQQQLHNGDVTNSGSIGSASAQQNKHFMILQLCWMCCNGNGDDGNQVEQEADRGVNDHSLLSQSRCCLLSSMDLERNTVVQTVTYSNELIQTSFCKMRFNPWTGHVALPSSESVEVYLGRDISQRISSLKWNSSSCGSGDCGRDDVNQTGLGMLMALEFHRTGHHSLFGAFENGQVYEWDIRSPGQPVCVRPTVGHEPVMCIKNFALRGDSHRDMLAIAGTGHQLTFQSLSPPSSDSNNTSRKSYNCTLPTAGVNDVVIFNRERLLGTAGWDHRIRIFELKKPSSKQQVLKPLAIFKQHTSAVTCLDVNHDQTRLISASQDERLCVWSLDFRTKAKSK